MITLALFLLGLTAGLIVIGMCTAQMLTDIQFWPPPDTTGWQYWTFRWLFRILVGSLTILSVLDFGRLDAFGVWRLFVGIPLWVVGIGAAFYLTGFLGWRNAFGAEEGLKTDGFFRWSRNPIYTATFIGQAGWGLTVDSGYVYVLLGIWALFYVVAPFLEEPWLEARYGEPYRVYKTNVRRFF